MRVNTHPYWQNEGKLTTGFDPRPSDFLFNLLSKPEKTLKGITFTSSGKEAGHDPVSETPATCKILQRNSPLGKKTAAGELRAALGFFHE